MKQSHYGAQVKHHSNRMHLKERKNIDPKSTYIFILELPIEYMIYVLCMKTISEFFKYMYLYLYVYKIVLNKYNL